MTDSKNIGAARRLPDAAEWSKVYNDCINRNIALGAWKPELIKYSDLSRLVTLMWRYRYKANPYGTLDKSSLLCAVRGDLIKPGIHYDASKTTAKSTFYASQRLFDANAALKVL